jgi:hypothetical protein
MKKSHKLCVAFAAVFIAAVSFSSVVCAAEVSRIQAHKGYIYINEGKGAGFLVGTRVCIYGFSGEEIACGEVKQTNPNYAMVKVEKQEAKEIKVGMKALISKPSPDQKNQ